MEPADNHRTASDSTGLLYQTMLMKDSIRRTEDPRHWEVQEYEPRVINEARNALIRRKSETCAAWKRLHQCRSVLEKTPGCQRIDILHGSRKA